MRLRPVTGLGSALLALTMILLPPAEASAATVTLQPAQDNTI